MTSLSVQPERASRFARRAGVFVVLVAMLVSSLVSVNTRDADALSSFDAEVLRLINNHRQSLGLTPFVEYAPMSSGSLAWSTQMRDRSGAPCDSTGYTGQHASEATMRATQPPGTSSIGENIAFACGPIGSPQSISWSYSRMPSNCSNRIDYSSPLMMFCQWIDSSSHRSSIESANFTHIGLGTASRQSSGYKSNFSTNRFARAPIAPNTCDGRNATVDLSRGIGSPTNGADVIVGTSGADTINGLGGNDIICGLGGNDRIIGGAGNDTIFGGSGDDTIQGDDGKDELYGGTGGDTITGGAQGDILYGNNGNDSLSGGDGWDTIYGQAGSDTLRGGTGTDKLYGGASGDWIYGGNGPDDITGGDGNDVIDAGNGADTVSGGNGNDSITGSNGPDGVWGNSGADTINGGTGGDKLSGGSGNDRLNGEGGWDSLNGGANTDNCDGGFGQDTASQCEARIAVP